MLITLETSRAEALQQAAMQTLQRAEEFARLYGLGALSQQTMFELMGIRSDRSPPLVFESTPSRRPNAIMELWANSVAQTIPAAQRGTPRGIFVVDSLTGVDEE
jgi:hypothetical protein